MRPLHMRSEVDYNLTPTPCRCLPLSRKLGMHPRQLSSVEPRLITVTFGRSLVSANKVPQNLTDA
jgi:hypothetical protein